MSTKNGMTSVGEAAHAALRLVREGMGLGKAVRITSGAFGFSEDDIYREIAKLTGED